MVGISDMPPELHKFVNKLGRMGILLMLTDQAFYRVDLQISRIKVDILDKSYQSLYSDIHFFLIAVENLRKVVKKMYDEAKQDQDTEYISIYNKYNQKLTYLSDFRDHLEHITDGRIEGKNGKGLPLKTPETLSSLRGYEYSFGGEKFNLKKSFMFLENLLVDLKKWNRNLHYYPSWH